MLSNRQSGLGVLVFELGLEASAPRLRQLPAAPFMDAICASNYTCCRCKQGLIKMPLQILVATESVRMATRSCARVPSCFSLPTVAEIEMTGVYSRFSQR